MKLAAGWIFGMFAGLASATVISRAEPSLDECGAGPAPRQLVETACEVDAMGTVSHLSRLTSFDVCRVRVISRG